MGAPLRKSRVVANDFYRPALALLPAMPPGRVIPFVRLSPAPPRRDFSLAVALATVFMAATIVLLGAVAGAVFWFTYDADARVADIAPPAPVAAKIAEAPPEILAAQPEVLPTPPVSPPAPADIVLPAESLMPPQAAIDADAAAPGKPNDLQMTMRDAKPEEADDFSGDAGAEATAAKILARHGNFPAAIAHLTRAAQAEPDNVLYRLDLAILYDRNRQAAEALALYRQVLDAMENGGLQESDASDAPSETGETGEAAETAAPLSPQALAAIRTRAGYLEGMKGQ